MADEGSSVDAADVGEQTHDGGLDAGTDCLAAATKVETDGTETQADDVMPLKQDGTGANGEVCTAALSDDRKSPVDDVSSMSCEPAEMVQLKVVYNKQQHDVSFALDNTVEALKQHIEQLTDVPVAMQKLMFKGRMNDGSTLRNSKVTNGSKIMLVGSTINDVLSVNEPSAKSPKQSDRLETTSNKESLCKQKAHKTVLDKHGKPEDAMPGIRARPEPLPPYPISGMYNKAGGKVRLTFKLEANQVWIGTKERTEKVSLGSIKSVVSEPIEGHEEYHLMALQLGPTEASRYWIYWVPAQFVEAIKDAILGNWQYF